jgi:hypothetical protein
MADKRFWSSAILVATVVVAGASALPALLLAPSASGPIVVAVTPAPVEKRAEPVVARVAPAAPAPEEVAAPQPPETLVPIVPPPVPVREAAPGTFPPVQPVGIATSKMDSVPTPATPLRTSIPAAAGTSDRPVTEKPVRAQHAAARRVTKHKRNVVRPALYPLREFFAWRR